MGALWYRYRAELRDRWRGPVVLGVVVGISIVTLAALVVALPVGVVLGRTTARLFADEIGAVTDLVVPVGALALLVPLALVIANLVAFVPGRIAGRTRPAVVLRSE